MTKPDSQPTPPGQRSRLEDEVLEILVRTDQPPSLRDHIRRKAARRRHARLAGVARDLPAVARGLGPGAMLVGALAVAVLAALLRPSSPLFAQLLAVASVALLGGVYLLRSRGGRGPRVKQWRGRDIDLSPPPPAWMTSLRERFRRPPRR